MYAEGTVEQAPRPFSWEGTPDGRIRAGKRYYLKVRDDSNGEVVEFQARGEHEAVYEAVGSLSPGERVRVEFKINTFRPRDENVTLYKGNIVVAVGPLVPATPLSAL